MVYRVGVDIGGTNTKIGIVSEAGEILKKNSIKTNSVDGVEKTMERIWNEIKRLLNELSISVDDLQGVGMGIPGPVKNQEIVGIFANFPWEQNLNISKIFENISGKKTKLENDVNVIALGEATLGTGKGCKTSVTIALGTGVGGGIYINGNLVSGYSGSGGEVGHIKIVKDGNLCGCGQKGCLETYASATGIEREATSRLRVNKQNKLYENINGNIEKLEAKDVFDAAKEGDEFSLDIVDYTADHLAMGLGNILNVINPEKVILTGGVALAGDILLDRVKKYLPKYAFKGAIDENFKIELGSLKEDAGILGAAALI